ncbi:MAG: cyclase [Rhodospirillales bacterium 69-11]|nr:MAG: cyclase [Rhodospirillales bacterium 69-11]
MEPFRDIGKRLSNWGRWGKDDRLGTLNHITPERVAAAARLVKTGKILNMGLSVGANGIQPAGSRVNPVHLMNITSLDQPLPNVIVADDYIFMPLQSVTQWDGLAHVGYDGRLYNDVPAETVTTMNGSTVISIEQIAEKGVAGRGVLLDITALNGVDRLKRGYAIEPAELEAAEKKQGVKVGPGDILIVRTGWIRHFLIDKSVPAYWDGEPGLSLACGEWLHKREVAAVCSDNWGVEVVDPPKRGADPLPLHCVLIRDMGMTLGEVFDLEALAKDCAADNVWEFLFTAPPLKVIGGVGTPITPLALK